MFSLFSPLNILNFLDNCLQLSLSASNLRDRDVLSKVNPSLSNEYYELQCSL